MSNLREFIRSLRNKDKRDIIIECMFYFPKWLCTIITDVIIQNPNDRTFTIINEITEHINLLGDTPPKYVTVDNFNEYKQKWKDFVAQNTIERPNTVVRFPTRLAVVAEIVK